MLKIFLLLGIVVLISSIVGFVLIIIDKKQSKKYSCVNLVDAASIIFENDNDDSVLELEII